MASRQVILPPVGTTRENDIPEGSVNVCVRFDV